MRISRIRLQGFKSFARKTEFVLDPGITAIVGPNGCGKSNVIDAVKWVLGEQKPSSLRAKEMMDVIFAGTESRKPVGMAEVAVVFDNEDGKLPIDRPEVVLTRRLYRSGESEYLLNGEACRLKDLRETLMDTGSGLDALSIMEQGRIDAILTANPAERRVVFEDAAGIGRFKARRKETLRRLERIGDDLTRLRDVIEITEKQLRSLRYQASRATRYREYSEELRKKRVTWALYRYHLLLTEREELSARLTEAADREEKVSRELRALIGDLSGEEATFEQLGAKVAEAETALLTLDAEIRSDRERAEHSLKMTGELADRVKWYEEEIRVTERRITEMGTEKDGLGGDLAALAAEVTLRESELRTAEEAIATARAAEASRELDLRNLRQERVGVVQRGVSVRNRRSTLRSEIAGGEALEQRISVRRSALIEEREGLTGEREEAARDHEAKAAKESGLRENLLVAEQREVEFTTRLADLNTQVAEADRVLTAGKSRLDLLLSLKARHAGMDQPVQEILKEVARAGSALSGVRGVVAELIKVKGADAEAVELALGACAQGIVTECLDDALVAIAWLKEKRLGRALFIPLDGVREAGPTYTGNGVARSAMLSVTSEGEYADLVRALLSDSILVENLDRARQLSADAGRSLRIITGGGEVLNRIGTISGGRGNSAAALLARNSEIEELEGEVSEAEERQAALREALAGLRSSRDEVREEVRGLRALLTEAGREAGRSASRLERLEGDASRLANEDRVLEIELAEVLRQREESARRDLELAGEEEEATAEEERIGREVEALGAALDLAREESRGKQDQRMELSVVLARSRERLAGAEARFAGLERGIAEARETVQVSRREMESCEQRRVEAALDAEVAAKRSEENAGRRERRLSDVTALRTEHERARAEILSRRQNAEDLRERHEEYRGVLEEFRLKESEVRTRLEGLLERVQEEFELDLVDLYQGFSPEGIDWEELDREVAELKGKLEKMGNVNLEAIDQLAEVDERVKFLHAEETDLLSSKESLLEILRKVNRESRERFETAFVEVRENFREMFRKLFGGGSAEVSLTEGEDILEAGIEIMVRPPGRDLKNINLLSGGEKTLTAVALLFAIFKARPSPFAIMDEVDAALDESNIDRFLGVLREFTHESQFIIITHNKRTMADADALYGVTMPEAGISQPMSMRFYGGEAEPTPEPAESTA
jgi:chromosome segregation protein